MPGTSILIVDDDKAQQLRLATLLRQDGYRVQLASSGEEALANALATPPDLLLSDVMMSGMDGYELAMSFKGDPKLRHIPIALHSSVFTDARDRLLAEAIGVTAFFDKSISVGTLLQQLKELAHGNHTAAGNDSFDETKFLRMRARVLSDKVGLKHNQLESERYRADTSAQQLQTITDAMPDLISEVGTDYRYRYVNKAYEQWHGKPWQEIVGHHIEELMGKEAISKVSSKLERAMRGENVDFEERFYFSKKGVRDMWIRYLPNSDKAGNITCIHIIASDITERKAAESQLQKANHCYMVMLQINKLISHADSEQQLLDGACEIIRQGGDFPLTWIGFVEHDTAQRVVPVAQAGFEQGDLDHLHISWGDNEFGHGPTGRAIRSGTAQRAEDIHHNPDYAAWRKEALQHDYASFTALPISIDGEVVAALNIYAREPFAFAGGDMEMLEKLAGDIGHGIHTLRLKQERQQIEDSLLKANRAYRTLVQLKKSLARHHHEAGLLNEVCQLLIDSGSYRLAWIGLAEQESGKVIQSVASAGAATNYLENMSFSWGDNPLDEGPSGRSIRHNKTVIINDVESDAGFTPWREAAIRNGYRSLIALPLRQNDKACGCLTLYADVSNAFYPEEVELLEELAEELSLGITALRQQDRHQKTVGELAYQRKLFEAVFRHIPDTMVITDTEHRIILCNSALIRDFGYFPEDLFGHSPARLYADEAEFQRQQQLRFHHTASDIHTPYNIEYRRKDGTSFNGETLGAVFRDKEKNLLGYITIVRDITERQVMEGERAQLEMQLQQAQKMEMVGQLTGGIAHDFNNILASMLGYTELAEILAAHDGEQDKAKMARYLHEIHGAGERARDIIAQLLAFSRTGESEQQLIELAPLIEETASLLKPTLSSSIELTLKLDAGRVQIEADPNQLHQVVMNLCINARDAMEGRGRIALQLTQRHHQGLCSACGEKFQGDYLQLSISDNGSGIPEEVVTRMFDPFFTTKEVGKGSGMGLSMVHGIIHEHRGHIQVTTSGEGTTFDIFLPISSAGEPTTTGKSADGHDTAPHIVLIDDEPLMVEFLQQLLQFNGYQVTGYSEPEEALAALLRQHLPCDLVITDQMMPGINGIELARQLRQQRPELPLVLCSANLGELDEEAAQHHGFNGLLAKPIESVRLISLVQKLLYNTPKPPG